MRLYTSVAVFLFSALSLIIPSGYSYGAILLSVASPILLIKRFDFSFKKSDWIVVGVIFLYAVINVFLNFYHVLPLRSYDRALRFLLVIPVYLLLIAYPPKKIFFWSGLSVGALGAMLIAVWQSFVSNTEWGQRASGFMNPIQFGDISLLISALLLVGVLWAENKKLKYILFISSMMAFLASMLALTRGGWVAIPLICIVLYKLLDADLKRKVLLQATLILVAGGVFFYLLPENNFFKTRVFQTQTEITNYFQENPGQGNTSVNTRMKMWENGLYAFRERPVLGWGDLNAIKMHFAGAWIELNNIDNYNHLHNEYIDELAKRGLIGLMGLLSLYIVPLVYFLRSMQSSYRDTKFFAASGVVLIVSTMVFGLTQCFLVHNGGTMIFLFYLVIIKAYCRDTLSARAEAC